MSEEVKAGLLGAFIGFLIAGPVYGMLAAHTWQDKIAHGEIACEYHYGERVCWNPKEDEK